MLTCWGAVKIFNCQHVSQRMFWTDHASRNYRVGLNAPFIVIVLQVTFHADDNSKEPLYVYNKDRSYEAWIKTNDLGFNEVSLK